MTKTAQTCEYCNKPCKSLAGLKAHQRHCKAKTATPTKSITTTADNTLDTNYRVDIGKALKLRLDNKLSYQAIGDKLGCSKQHIHQALTPFLKLIDNPEALHAYQNNRANLLDAAEMELLTKIVDPDKLQKASLNNMAYAIGNLNNLSRLERGQSTSNVINIHQDIKELRQHEGRSYDSDVPGP